MSQPRRWRRHMIVHTNHGPGRGRGFFELSCNERKTPFTYAYAGTGVGNPHHIEVVDQRTQRDDPNGMLLPTPETKMTDMLAWLNQRWSDDDIAAAELEERALNEEPAIG